MSDPTDDVQARLAKILLADKYGADPWLQVARYQVLTDDLLKRLDDAEVLVESLDLQVRFPSVSETSPDIDALEARVAALAEALAEARDWIFEDYEPETALTPDYHGQLLNRLDATLAAQLLSDVAAPGGAVTPAGTASLPDACEVAPSSGTGAATQDDVIGAMQRGMTYLFERLARAEARTERAEKALEHRADNRSSLDRAYGFKEEVERLRRHVSEAEHLAADQSQSADEWQERAERAEVRREVACTELRTRVERAERERDDVRATLETLDMQQLISDIVETAESLASPDTEEGAA